MARAPGSKMRRPPATMLSSERAASTMAMKFISSPLRRDGRGRWQLLRDALLVELKKADSDAERIQRVPAKLVERGRTAASRRSGRSPRRGWHGAGAPAGTMKLS
jgi:hypothetical protein